MRRTGCERMGRGTLIYPGHMVISCTEGALYPCLWIHLLLLARFGCKIQKKQNKKKKNHREGKGKLHISLHFPQYQKHRTGRIITNSNHPFTVTHSGYKLEQTWRHGARSATQQLPEPTVFPEKRKGEMNWGLTSVSSVKQWTTSEHKP